MACRGLAGSWFRFSKKSALTRPMARTRLRPPMVFCERAETLVQMAESSRYCYEDLEEIGAKAAKKHLRPVILEPLVYVRHRFEALSDWT
jgi:hypothetical protein